MSDASYVLDAPDFLFTLGATALLVAGGVWVACLAAFAILTVVNAIQPDGANP